MMKHITMRTIIATINQKKKTNPVMNRLMRKIVVTAMVEMNSIKALVYHPNN